MAKPGPAPKPPELKAYEGNAGKDNLLKFPRPKIEMPSCPTWLGREAKREWDRIVEHLFMANLISQLDRATLAAYCQAYEDWWKASKEVASLKGNLYIDNGEGWVGMHPAVYEQRKARRDMISIAKEFGMTPSSRGQIELPPPGQGSLDDILED